MLTKSRGVLAFHGLTSPDDQGRRATDASRLTFDLRLVVTIVASVIAITMAVVGAFWVATSAIRSDVRDILTRMEMSARTDVEKSKSQELRDSILRDQIGALRDQMSASERRQELLRLEFQQLREQVLFKSRGVK